MIALAVVSFLVGAMLCGGAVWVYFGTVVHRKDVELHQLKDKLNDCRY